MLSDEQNRRLAQVGAGTPMGELLRRYWMPIAAVAELDDKATKPSGSQQFFDTVGAIAKTLKLSEGGSHDLLNDTDREQVMADVSAWIERQLGARQTAERAAVRTSSADAVNERR